MSTTINVTVGGNGLLDQSRQQMQANRFGRLERDVDNETLSAAKRQKDQQQAQLSEPSGRLSRIRRITNEPAANRRSGGGILLIPSQGPFNADGDIRGKSGYRNADLFVRTYTRDPIYDGLYVPSIFVPSGGPGGAAYLESSDQWNTTPLFQRRNVYQVTSFISSNSQYIGFDSSSNQLITANGLEQFVPGPKSRFQQFTLEAWVREAKSGIELRSYFSSCQVIIEIGLRSLTGKGIIANARIDRSGGGFNVPRTPGHELAFGVTYEPDQTAINGYYSFTPIAYPPGRWHHVAIVKTVDAYLFFFNGAIVPIAAGNISLESAWNALDDVYAYIRLDMENLVNLYGDYEEPMSPSAVHGLRFTPRARYTAPFTPPVSITKL